MDMGMQPGNGPMMGMDPGMQNPMMGGEAPQGPDTMGGDPMGGPEMGGDPNAMGGQEQNQFDTNFDAGVEADEETDPKRYIQQLTGKLSQTLNSYNSENGEDPGLAKYVGKMIVKQAAKALDEKGRKDLIQAINTADSSDDDMEEPEDNEMDEPLEGQDVAPEEQPMEEPLPKQPMQEIHFTKADLIRINENVNNKLFYSDRQNLGEKPQKKVNKQSRFGGKNFNK